MDIHSISRGGGDSLYQRFFDGLGSVYVNRNLACWVAIEKRITFDSNLKYMLRFVSLLEEMDPKGCAWKR